MEKGNTYWENNGKYQKQYDELYEQLVPSHGEANTLEGEILRGSSRLYYDYFNNGNCNVVQVENVYDYYEETCSNCQGEGREEYSDEVFTCFECDGTGTVTEVDEYFGDVTIDDYYKQFINLFKQHLPNKELVERFEQMLTDKSIWHGDNYFTSEIEQLYEDMVDHVIEYVMSKQGKYSKLVV